MPEELGIALLILIVVGWGLFKLLAFVFTVFDNGTKEFSNWQSKKANERLAQKRKAFERHLRIAVPNELNPAERDLDRLRSQFKEAQQIKSWVPVCPSWTKADFASLPPPMQLDATTVVNVGDLCAVVHKEGASRGILVTTSVYGPDAYAFVENQPITLLNGSQLLGLLQKHGYSFKIDIEQA